MREEDACGEQPSAEDSGVLLEEATAMKKKIKAADFRITQVMMEPWEDARLCWMRKSRRRNLCETQRSVPKKI